MAITLNYVDRGPNKYESGQFFNHMRKISQSSHPTVDLLNFVVHNDMVFEYIHFFITNEYSRQH
jgi:hypothetical protein